MYTSVLFLIFRVCRGVQSSSSRNTDSVLLHVRDDLPSNYTQSPPYYPTPYGGWISSWNASYARAAAVVANMTLAEKVNLTSGTGYISKADFLLEKFLANSFIMKWYNLASYPSAGRSKLNSLGTMCGKYR